MGYGANWRGALLASGLAAWLVLQLPLSAAVITVSGGCTLVDAITAANTDAAVGSCTGGSGPDRIVLTGDVLLDLVDNHTDGPNALPSVVSEITIQGDGHAVQKAPPIGPTVEFRLFHVGQTGRLTLLDTSVRDGFTGSPGGGGFFNRGELALTHSTVSGNVAIGYYAAGGGVFNEGGTLTLTNSNLSSNRAYADYDASGGGIYNDEGTVTLTNSTLTDNDALGDLYSYGGAIANFDGHLALRNTTISMNAAGISDQGYGGGVHNVFGEMTIVNSSLYGNTVTFGGGGSGEALYTAAGTLRLKNSIVHTEAYGVVDNCDGVIVDEGGNFGSDDSCPRIASPTGWGIIPADNSGPGITHAVYPGSNLIDQDPSCGLLVDGREALRDGNCEAGSFELDGDDRYEASGPGGDDTCPGHRVLVDKTERHLHEEDAEDWIRFRAVAGATYEIRTGNLLWNSNTELELSENCGPPLATDTDGGEGVASLISYTPVGDALVDVRIRDEVGPGGRRGYDVEVACIANCPVCALPGSDTIEVRNEVVYSFRRVEACTWIRLRDPITIRSGAEANFFAGHRIEVRNGVVVEQGGTLVLGTDANLQSP